MGFRKCENAFTHALSSGNMILFFTREKPYFPRKTPEGNMTISRVNTFSYLPYAMEMNVVLYISGVIFTNLIKALNLENFE
jgi:hypothetical protein